MMRMATRFLRGVVFVLLLGVIPWVSGPLGCGDDCDLDITTSALPDATEGQPYNVILGSHCGGDDWFLASGDLPPGISLINDGALRGTPQVPGRFLFTVGLLDFHHGFVEDTAYRGLSLTVRSSAIVPTPTATITPTATVTPTT